MRRGEWLIVLALIALPVLRVVSTYHVFSEVVDEPSHVAAGLQWLQFGRFDIDPEHPPLARVMFALEPFLTGATMPQQTDKVVAGNEILYRNGRYRQNLENIRAANLPFLVIALVAVWRWARRTYGAGTAILALALIGAIPTVLGHAGLATTDMAVTALVVVASYAFSVWLDEPTWRNAILLGIGLGVGLITKFSFLVFFAVAAAGLVVLQRGIAAMRIRAPQMVGIAAIAILIVFSAYRFTTGTINDVRLHVFPSRSPELIAARYATEPGYGWMRADLLHRFWDYSNVATQHGFNNVDFVDWAKAAGYPSPLAGRHGDTIAGAPALPRPSLTDRFREPFRAAWQWIAVHFVVPAPYFFAGAEYVARHSRTGHPAYLLGQYSDTGWWYYFPVVFFFKTPLAFLALAIVGIAVLVRAGGVRAAIAITPLVMLGAAMTSHINIGVRHVLPVYPFLAIAAATAQKTLPRLVVVVLLGWYFVAGAIAHPDYLPYFNELAGPHPEQIAIDSNLDWGQDLLRLADIVHKRGVEHIYISYFGAALWSRHIVEVENLPRTTPVGGWIAVSEMNLKFGGPTNRGDGFEWLRQYKPVTHAGKSIRVYYVPEKESRSSTAPGRPGASGVDRRTRRSDRS